MTVRQIAAGIIMCNGKMLIAQRLRGKTLAYFWELPGGKLEDGETLQECLKRELIEEMELEIKVGDLFMTSTYEYDFGTFVINAFMAECATPEIKKLCVHEQYKWVDPQEALNYNFSPADIPIIKRFAETSAVSK